jgi:hypoxanthine phosphoribosyltransferase
MSRRRRASQRPPADVLAARANGELIASAEQVTSAIDRLSVRLSLALADANPLLLTVMHGALPFAGALLPRLNFPLEIGYLHVGRYRDATRGGTLRWHATPDYQLAGRNVLVLDDVLDRGETLAELLRWAEEAGAESVVTAVLADKRTGLARPVEADHVALECPDRYLFGCGMDYKGYWRNLPAIYALPPELETL